MRAVSLSDDRVISILNSSFVPVFTSNEDYRDGGAAPADERALLNAIRQDGLKKGLSVGTVHAFVISPAGSVIDSRHTVDAAKPDSLLAMLRSVSERLAVKPGPRLVGARNAPPAPAEGLTLSVTARYLERRDGKLGLVENAGGNWSALPGQDRVTITADEVRQMIRGTPAMEGPGWERLLLRFYPPTENNDCAKNKITAHNISVRRLNNEGVVWRHTFSGTLRMKHPFYHKDDDWRVEASFAGYFDVDTNKAVVRKFRMVTESAEYVNGSGQRLPFGVAVREVSAAKSAP